jgi:hypothetical protein
MATNPEPTTALRRPDVARTSPESDRERGAVREGVPGFSGSPCERPPGRPGEITLPPDPPFGLAPPGARPGRPGDAGDAPFIERLGVPGNTTLRPPTADPAPALESGCPGRTIVEVDVEDEPVVRPGAPAPVPSRGSVLF